VVRIFGVVLALCCPAMMISQRAAGQSSTTEGLTLQQELERLGTAEDTLEHSLPSFSCQEIGVSQWLVGSKMKERDEFTATLRSRRGADGTQAETYVPTVVNGRPFSGGNFSILFYVAGGFDRAMRYFAPVRQVCYRYSLAPGRIEFETAPDAASHAQCPNEGLHGFALLDGEGDVSHLERTVSAKAAQMQHLAPFAAIDFAAIDLNGHTFRLSSHMFSELSQGRTRVTFDATYTDCRLFTTTVTIGPATPANEAEPGEMPAPR
jgi:hypothetical protein